MPYIIRPPRQMRRLVTGVFSSLALLCAAPAIAAAGCPSTATSNAFASFGDSAAYSLVQDGRFESGAQGWSLLRSEVVNEESPLGGTHALVVNFLGRAVSPGFCVSSNYPSFRFLFRQLRGNGKLRVNLRWEGPGGVARETLVANLEGSSSWSVSPVLGLAKNLPLASPEGTLNPVQLVFMSWRPGTAWAIDDVYLDPYSR